MQTKPETKPGVFLRVAKIFHFVHLKLVYVMLMSILIFKD